MLLQGFPAATHSDRRGQKGRCIKIQVVDLCKHIVDLLRRLKAEPIQHQLRLVRNVTQAGSFIFPIAYGIPQSGVSHSSNDGVSIRISMTSDINRIHKNASPL